MENSEENVLNIAIDMELLVGLVKSWPSIWDPNSESYKQRTAEAWDSIAMHLMADYEALDNTSKSDFAFCIRNKWINVKQYYVKIIKQLKADPTCKTALKHYRNYFLTDKLSFLDDIYQFNPSVLKGLEDEDVCPVTKQEVKREMAEEALQEEQYYEVVDEQEVSQDDQEYQPVEQELEESIQYQQDSQSNEVEPQTEGNYQSNSIVYHHVTKQQYEHAQNDISEDKDHYVIIDYDTLSKQKEAKSLKRRFQSSRRSRNSMLPPGKCPCGEDKNKDVSFLLGLEREMRGLSAPQVTIFKRGAIELLKHIKIGSVEN